MTVDWKSNLLTVARAPRAELARAVEQAIASGASLDDVTQFAVSQPALSPVVALVKDGFFNDRGQKAVLSVVGGDVDRKRAALTSTGLKAHAVRFDPASALPWFNKAGLPPTPTSTLQGSGSAVVVDGERFTASDVAALLRLAA